MDSLGPQRLLEVWELGSRRHPIDRALLLFALAEPGIAAEQLADLPLARRNAAIMALRHARFGNPMPVWYDCPVCGERMELSIEADQLPEPPQRDATACEIDGLRFVSPSSRQLAALADATDPDQAAYQFLRACSDSPASLPTQTAQLQTLLNAVDAALEQADPWLDLTIAVTCPACAAPSEPSLDIPALVWDEIDAIAHRLLDQVHQLARTYGWCEQDILGMSEHRRNAYLDRVQA